MGNTLNTNNKDDLFQPPKIEEKVVPEEEEEPTTMLIAGGGIVGLVLAMSIQTQLGIRPEIYEKTSTFATEAGAGLGMYPNGLRVLRDIHPDLLEEAREAGYPYVKRCWERHDGTHIVSADEHVLSDGDFALDSIGIRRSSLQKVLYKHAQAMGISITFNKPLESAEELDNGLIRVTFGDGSSRLTKVLFGADGALGKARSIVAGENEPALAYTGTTCLMGLAKIPCDGIYFPSSNQDDFHAVFFPTAENEMCFQFHEPIVEENANSLNWGNLSDEVAKVECGKIADKLRQEGWHDKYVAPLNFCIKAVRVGFALLEPRLDCWVKGRMVLVGDAAHPPVPYVGQGAQQGLEDAGVAVALLKHYCLDENGEFDPTNFEKAMKLYQDIRIKRSSQILDISKGLGKMQADRAGRGSIKKIRDGVVEGEVLAFGTIPVLMDGSDHDYKKDVVRATQDYKLPSYSTAAVLDSLRYLLDDVVEEESETGSVPSIEDPHPIVRSKLRRRLSNYAYTMPVDRRVDLCNWVAGVMEMLLKEIVARRNTMSNAANREALDLTEPLSDASISSIGHTVVDEVCEVIDLPDSPVRQNKALEEHPDSIVLPKEVVGQLRDYIEGVALLYHSNPFHNFEHACNVTMNVFKLLTRMSDSPQQSLTVRDKALDAIISDPLTEFGCILAALLHDADHDGVPNAQLAKEHPQWAEIYNGRSIAEQNSVDLAWALLMSPKYKQLRSTIYKTESEFRQLRQLVVNMVMATDICDKELKEFRNGRWEKAFSAEEKDEVENLKRKATIGVETLIQIADVCHTMQPWHVYRKWNRSLYEEMHKAYNEGRSGKDPKEFWFKGEIGFFDFYIIPLAKKVIDSGLFGDAGDELLANAHQNKEEWIRQGEGLVEEMVALVAK